MLHRTLRRASAESAHHSGDAAKAAILGIERRAGYLSFYNLGLIHHHDEPNYRKKPARWAGYGPKFAEPFPLFGMQCPVRHVDKTNAGIWMGMGHINMKMLSNWKTFWLWGATGFIGHSLYLGIYLRRMYANGWKQKNKGAVFGTD